MNQQDTIQLLNQCHAGAQMAVSSLNDVLPSVEDPDLRSRLYASLEDHNRLAGQAVSQLQQLHQPEKTASTMARSMSWLKTNIRLAVSPGDHSVADLVTDGCNMGVKTLRKSCNRFTGAGQAAKDLAADLMAKEAGLVQALEPYL